MFFFGFLHRYEHSSKQREAAIPTETVYKSKLKGMLHLVSPKQYNDRKKELLMKRCWPR